MKPLLEISGLSVTVEGKTILDGLDVAFDAGQSYVLFGPNGSGKTTLISAIMGVPGYDVIAGSIIFEGRDVTQVSLEERARLGMSMAFQHPPEITGVKLGDMLKLCLGKKPADTFSEDEVSLIEDFELSEFLNRDINLGFSGGERKRSEVLQMIFLRPKLLMLDEPDSGVDIESLKLIATQVQRYAEESDATLITITHQGEILDYVQALHACVLMNSRIYCYADPREILKSIRERGYQGCIECQWRQALRWQE